MLTRHILPYFLSLLSRHLCLVSYRIVKVTEEVALHLLDWAKGAAGWFMNSAALLADAGHSLSGKHALQLAALL
jgi:hypothetical protein